jgi:hypothetical protein
VFGVYSCWSIGTLLDALNTTDNPYDWYGNGYGVKALQREAVAALLNASNPNVNFKYSVDDIIWKVRTAYTTGMYQLYADCLYIENNRGGDPEILEGREYVLDVTVYFCYCSLNQYAKFPNRQKKKVKKNNMESSFFWLWEIFIHQLRI